MDLKDFTEATFDAKHWINSATKNLEKEDDKEKMVTTLITKLQVYFQQLNTEFVNTAQNVIQNLPKVMKDAEKLSEYASNLQDKMNSVKEEIERIKKNTGLTIASLEKIDTVKMELVKYKEALHEADKWTVLSNEIKSAIDAREIDTIITKVITMQQSLNVLSKAPDFEDKQLELESFKNQLEAMASPLLLQAFTSKSVEQTRKYVQVFCDINRLPQLLKLYSQNQKSLLIQSWDLISEMESEENCVVDSLQKYYALLLLTWEEQVKWCNSVFSQTTGLSILMDIYKDLLVMLSPKFLKFIESNLKQVVEPSALLLELKQCTQEFALNLKSLLLDSEESEQLSNLAKAIYLPYKTHISKFGAYQEAALHPHLLALSTVQEDIMESVQSLPDQSSKAFLLLSQANKLCADLTECCSCPGLLRVAECFLTAYLNQYRIIKNKISENARKLEEVNVFQMCLTVLQHIGNFISELKQFEHDCLRNIAKAKEHMKENVHPFLKYPSLLLDEAKQKDLDNLVKQVEKEQILRAVYSVVKDLAQDTYDTTYSVIFEPISTILSSVSTAPIWDTKKGQPSDLPDYSFVPQEYITQIGQYLMNLPQLLDSFLLSKNPELTLALTTIGADYSALDNADGDDNAFPEMFLSQIAKGTCKAYAKHILAIHELPPTACKQLATDINYLGNVLEDLGFTLSKKLQEIGFLLKLSPSEYGAQSSGCSPLIVAGVRQMRNIISG